MDLRKHLSLLVFVLYMLFTFYGPTSEACSCMLTHPQTQFCEADYVALVRVVRKSQRLVANKIVYKVEIKRAYKMNAEGHKTLKHGRIMTSNSDASCGVHLEIGKLYTIAGRGDHLSLCSYAKEYTKMSIIERRGFSGVYSKGCKCHIKNCFGTHCLLERESARGCKWSPFSKCETEFSACMPTSYRTPEGIIAKCHWRRTPAYKACMMDPSLAFGKNVCSTNGNPSLPNLRCNCNK